MALKLLHNVSLSVLRYIHLLIEKSEISYLIDIFHVLFGICRDALVGYAHYRLPPASPFSPHYPQQPQQQQQQQQQRRRNSHKLSDTTGGGDASDTCDDYIEHTIVAIILKPLMSRLLLMENSLKREENWVWPYFVVVVKIVVLKYK